MGKRSRSEAEGLDKQSNGKKHSKKSIVVDEATVDPSLALLFASSVSIAFEMRTRNLEFINEYKRPGLFKHPQNLDILSPRPQNHNLQLENQRMKTSKRRIQMLTRMISAV
jgi:hypothetical protein